MARFAFAVAVVLLFVSGCSGGSPTFTAARTNITVDPHTFEEVNLEMKKGDTIDYSWSSTGPLSFDIHSHQGNDVIEWVTKDGTSYAGKFTADYDGGFSLLWENKGTGHPSLTYNVSGEGTKLGS